MNVKYKKQISENYQLLTKNILGKGYCGDVIMGIDKITQQPVAIKRIFKHKLTPKARNHFNVETWVLNKCQQHSQIVQMVEVLEDDQVFYIVMEYLRGGDLFEYLTTKPICIRQGEKKRKEEDEEEDEDDDDTTQQHLNRLINLFYQITCGVEFLHAHDIVHHDLKLENVLLDDTQTKAKLIDFGLCCTQGDNELLQEFSGSEPYCPPEILEGKAYCGKAADVYCLGVVLYLLLSRCYPFDCEDMEQRYAEQTNYNYLASLEFPSAFTTIEIPPILQNLTLQMLEPIPHKRLTIQHVKEQLYKYMFEKKLISSSLSLSPSSSFSIKQTRKRSLLTSSCGSVFDFEVDWMT